MYALSVIASSVLFSWLFNRTGGSVLPVLRLHTAVNAWSLVIPVMVLPDGSNLRPFQLIVGILVFAALLLLPRGDPTPQKAQGAGPLTVVWASQANATPSGDPRCAASNRPGCRRRAVLSCEQPCIGIGDNITAHQT